MKSFVPTTLTPTRTVLEKILNIEKYLAENPIVQVFSTTTQWIGPPHSGFPIGGLNNTNKNIAIGDVVFFINNYMGVVTGLGEGVYYVATAENIKGVQGDIGPAGPQGDIGPAGPQGEMGLNAGFGEVKGLVEALPNTAAPTIEIATSGNNAAKNFTFAFGIPKGNPGVDGAAGVDALVIDSPYRGGIFAPTQEETFSRSLFNRQPVYGDNVLVYCIQFNSINNTETLIGAAQCKVSEVQDDNIKLTSMGYYPIPASSGGQHLEWLAYSFDSSTGSTPGDIITRAKVFGRGLFRIKLIEVDGDERNFTSCGYLLITNNSIRMMGLDVNRFSTLTINRLPASISIDSVDVTTWTAEIEGYVIVNQ